MSLRGTWVENCGNGTSHLAHAVEAVALQHLQLDPNIRKKHIRVFSIVLRRFDDKHIVAILRQRRKRRVRLCQKLAHANSARYVPSVAA